MPNKNKTNFPFTLIIFGATGDLFLNKLSGSLLNLYSEGLMPELFQIICISRADYNTEQFRKFLKQEFQKFDKKYSQEDISNFLNNIFYLKGFFEDPDIYESIKKSLAPEDNDKAAVCLNKLYFLAVPPKYYELILKKLSDSGLSDSCDDKTGWSRILIEKPFGNDAVTAKKLDGMLGQLFKEKQIFRIDHYLAKDIIQNIIFFRFSNVIFDPIWNNNFIEKIEIKLLEKTDINDRGSFYDSIGALRDVGQNHILQMLALIAMDNPGSMNALSIRKERADVLKTLVPIDSENLINKYTVRGQYEGYKKSRNVSPNSNTETYFKIKAYLRSSRWKNVPFYLESGKALKEKKTEIIIHFREKCLYSEAHKKHLLQNKLIIKIFPEESILIRFWAKNPGLKGFPEPRDFEFSYHKRIDEHIEEYDKVLMDCLHGEQTLFLSTDEEKYAWKFITPILNNWNNTELYKYKKGSLGPKVKDLE